MPWTSHNDQNYDNSLIGSKKIIEHELKWLRKGGTLVLFGLSAKGTFVSLDVYQIYQKEIKIVSSCLSKFSYSRAVNLVHNMSSKYLSWEILGLKNFHLHDYEAAIEALANGEVTKAVFDMWIMRGFLGFWAKWYNNFWWVLFIMFCIDTSFSFHNLQKLHHGRWQHRLCCHEELFPSASNLMSNARYCR